MYHLCNAVFLYGHFCSYDHLVTTVVTCCHYTVDLLECQHSDMEDLYRSQFRMPYSLYERLKEAADHSGRSVNAELVYRLGQTFEFDGDKIGSVASLADKLALPENRGELEVLLTAIHRIASKN